MRQYLAPLEGITGQIYRNALQDCFGGFDKYFIPFLSPGPKGGMSAREQKEIDPGNNRGMPAVPQILTRRAEDFLRTADLLGELGYREVNLNLGCPSGTVVSKGKGAGFLAEPEELNMFLKEIFQKCELDISVKTRLGLEHPDEFPALLHIFNQYPMKELIVHPRVRTDFYKNKPNLELYELAVRQSENPLCYNGDITSEEDLQGLLERFPETDCVMLGRGVLADPALGRKLQGGPPAEKEELRKFHDQIYQAYKEEMSGDRPVLFKMKELWGYMGQRFCEAEKCLKKIRKSEKCTRYEQAVEELFDHPLKQSGEIHIC